MRKSFFKIAVVVVLAVCSTFLVGFGNLSNEQTIAASGGIVPSSAIKKTFVYVATDSSRSHGLTSEGLIYAWGGNSSSGSLGIVGSAMSVRPERVVVPDGLTFSTFAISDTSTLAVSVDGELWAWGNNADGRLGDGTETHITHPTRIGVEDNWSQVSIGRGHSLAINTDGELWAWGLNSHGQVGNGTTTVQLTPVQIGVANNWTSISTGASHSLALNSDGELWAWGNNSGGRLGIGNTTNSDEPVRVGLESNWTSISAGSSHSAAINEDYELWTWGANANGRLGDGTTTQSTIPVHIAPGTEWASVAISVAAHSLAITTDGYLYAWGINGGGRLGDGTTEERHAPIRIGSENNWVQVVAGSSQSFGLNSNNELFGWGSNNQGRLGDGTSVERHVPTMITSPYALDLDDLIQKISDLEKQIADLEILLEDLEKLLEDLAKDVDALETLIDTLEGLIDDLQKELAGLQGGTGAQGPQGPQGESGIRGATITRGTAFPTANVRVGDIFINSTTWNIYELMSVGPNVWESFGNIRGPQGDQGYTGEPGQGGDDGVTMTHLILVSGAFAALWACSILVFFITIRRLRKSIPS